MDKIQIRNFWLSFLVNLKMDDSFLVSPNSPSRKMFPLSMLSLGQTGLPVEMTTFLTQDPSRSLTRPSPQSWSDMAAVVRLARQERRATSGAVTFMWRQTFSPAQVSSGRRLEHYWSELESLATTVQSLYAVTLTTSIQTLSIVNTTSVQWPPLLV